MRFTAIPGGYTQVADWYRLWIMGRRDGGHAASMYVISLSLSAYWKIQTDWSCSIASDNRPSYGSERRTFSTNTGMGMGMGNGFASG